MDVFNLECFVRAAADLNFRESARRTHLSPAAFGQRIRQLEEVLGAPLFERTTRRVTLTKAGERLRLLAPPLLEQFQNLAARISEKPEIERCSLTLGTRHELGLSYVAPLISKLEKKIPGLTLNLFFGSADDILKRVQVGLIDAAITSSRVGDDALDIRAIHREAYVLVSSPKFLKARPIRQLSDMDGLPIVDISTSLQLMRYWLDADSEHRALRLGAVRGMGTIGAVRDYVQREGGVAVLPEYFVRDALKKKRLTQLFQRRPLLDDHFRYFYLRDHRHDAVLSQIADFLSTESLR